MTTRSLRARVAVLVLSAITAVVVPLVVATYAFTMSEVDELFDARLAENAKTMDALELGAADSTSAPETNGSTQPRSKRQQIREHGYPYQAQIGFQIWGATNSLKATSASFKQLALDMAPAGYVDMRVENRRWRVFTYLAPDGRWVRVGERYDSRRKLARVLAAQACLAVLIAFPLLAFLVRIGVRRGLRPLQDLAQQLAARPVGATEPLGSGNLPDELYPVIRSLNGLLQRLRRTLESERAFTSDAAHELHTPLTAALIHLDNARAASDPQSFRAALEGAHCGLDRLTRLINQLLELARWDTGRTQTMVPIDLRNCIDDELEQARASLADKSIELIRNVPKIPACVPGWAPGLRTLVRHLVENAICHSPKHGRIDVDLHGRDGYFVFAISDAGPGIPEPRRSQLSQCFRRGTQAEHSGAGIGLSLVARIAQLHRATVRLMDSTQGSGLRVEVRFPPLITRP